MSTFDFDGIGESLALRACVTFGGHRARHALSTRWWQSMATPGVTEVTVAGDRVANPRSTNLKSAVVRSSPVGLCVAPASLQLAIAIPPKSSTSLPRSKVSRKGQNCQMTPATFHGKIFYFFIKIMFLVAIGHSFIQIPSIFCVIFSVFKNLTTY